MGRKLRAFLSATLGFVLVVLAEEEGVLDNMVDAALGRYPKASSDPLLVAESPTVLLGSIWGGWASETRAAPRSAGE